MIESENCEPRRNVIRLGPLQGLAAICRWHAIRRHARSGLPVVHIWKRTWNWNTCLLNISNFWLLSNPCRI
jgi:hypothetical protein